MSGVTIVLLERDRLDAAAELLAARQRRLRALRPDLPAAFERPGAHRPQLDARIAWAHGPD